MRIHLVAIAGISCLDQNVAKPVLLDLEPTVAISAGGNHSCVRFANGNSGCWGSNELGQLGTLSLAESESSVPLYVSLPEDAIALASAGTHSCAILTDDTVACWGDNRRALLGFESPCSNTDNFNCASEPRVVPDLIGVTTIAAGGPRKVALNAPAGFSCAIEDNDYISCWGRHSGFSLGPSRPLWQTPQRVHDTQDFPLRNIQQLSAGETHACAVDSAGSVWCWGSAIYTNPQRIADIPSADSVSVGGLHTCIIAADDGGVWCWGENANWQLNSTTCTPSGATTCAPSFTGLYAIDVVSGQRHACALSQDGEVSCWGSNQLGQLGHSDEGRAAVLAQPVALPPITRLSAGTAHTCAVTTSDNVYCWGQYGGK